MHLSERFSQKNKNSPQLCFHVFFLVRNLNLGDGDMSVFLCPADTKP